MAIQTRWLTQIQQLLSYGYTNKVANADLAVTVLWLYKPGS